MKSLGQTFISNMSCLMYKHPPNMTHCVVYVKGYTLNYKHFHKPFLRKMQCWQNNQTLIITSLDKYTVCRNKKMKYNQKGHRQKTEN